MIIDPYRFGSGPVSRTPAQGAVALSGLAPTIEVADPDAQNVILLLHLNGSNGDTTTTDSSGLNKPVTITASHGASILTAAAKFGATGYKGVTSSSDVGGSMIATLGSDGVFAGDFTIEWFANPLGGNQVMAYFAGGAYVYANFFQNYDGANGQLAVTTSYSGYKHFAISRRSGTLYTFLDGVLSSSVAYSGSFNASTIEWARYVPNNNLYYTGYIDEVRVTAGVGRYAANFSVPTVPFLDPTSRRASPGAGAITATGRTPTVPLNTNFSPGAGSVTAAGVAPSLIPLDHFTSGLWGAYGIQKLSTSYAGSAIRVRKSTGGDTVTEQNIGFSGTLLDTTSLATFAGSETVVVTKVYDQSGNSRDMVQATTTKQPRIVNAGTYDGKLVFDGTDDEFATTATCTASIADLSTSGKMGFRANTPTQVIYACGPGGAAHFLAEVYIASGQTKVDVYLANSGGTANDKPHTSSAYPLAMQVQGFRHEFSATAANVCRWWQAGSEQSGTPAGAVTGSTTAETWRLGSGGGANYAKLDLMSFVIWESDQAANMASIATALA